MQTNISTILVIDEVEFENQRTEKYMRWCLNIARTQNAPLQLILANSSISKYYNYELAKLENKFLQLVDGKHQHMSQKSLNDIYSIIVVDIFNLTPKPLVDAAKKLTIINPPINSN